jgi:hypothetical protein
MLLLEGLKISANGKTPTGMDEITESPKISATHDNRVITTSTIIPPMHRAANTIYSSDCREAAYKNL